MPMDEVDASAVEPEFVGVGRRAVVEGLLAVFDDVRRTDTPAWVSIEAPSGWGKTRIAREFYARLAAERQTDPPYWPSSILAGASDVQFRRKRVHPAVTHVPGSLPDYMWWGISCSMRDGVATAVLTQDMGQFRAHADYLEDAWRSRAPRSERIVGGIRAFGAVAADEAAMEAVGTVAEIALGSAIPGLGLVRWLGERSIDAIRDAGARRDRLASDAAISTPADFVDEAVSLVSRLAIPGLPVVVFVEDLHDADETLIDVLTSLVSRPGAVLVLSTGWPGSTDANPAVAAAFARLGDRTIRVSHRSDRLPPPFPPDASLGDLDAAALAAIVRFSYPRVDDDTLRLIVERYPNPLALELFCELPRIRRRSRDGVLSLSPSTIADAPAEIRGLYQDLWLELPERLREALSLAALGAPARIGALGVSSHWNTSLLLEALHDLGWPSVDEIADSLRLDADAYSWVREVSEMLRAFHEPDQIAIASEDDRFIGPEDRVEVRTALAHAVARIAGDRAGDASVEESLHLADLVGTLFAEGFLDDPEVLAAATLPALRVLAGQPRELASTEEVATRVLDVLTTPWSDAAIDILRIRGDARLDLGKPIPASEDLLAVQTALTDRHGPQHRSVLLAREGMIRVLAHIGRTGLALEDSRRLLMDRVDALGTDDDDTQYSRHLVATFLARLGRHHEALDEYRAALVDAVALGLDERRIIDIRIGIADALVAVGDVPAANAQYEDLEEALTRSVGPDDDRVVALRAAHAAGFEQQGRVGEAIEIYREVVARHRRILGDEHPETLRSRDVLAAGLAAGGRAPEAFDEASEVYEIRLRVLGEASLETLDSTATLGVILGRLGESERALGVADAVIEGRSAVHGVDHPSTFAARENRAFALVEAGRVLEAIDEYRALIADEDRLAGGEMASAATRGNLILALTSAGRFDEAVSEARQALRRALEVSGSEHVGTVRLRAILAEALAGGGDAVAALAEYRTVLSERIRMVGPDHELTLMSRRWVADLLVTEERYVEALAEFDEIVASCERGWGADHHETLERRADRAIVLESAGRLSEAVDERSFLVAAWERTRGAGDDSTIAALRLLADALYKAGRPTDAAHTYLRTALAMVDAHGEGLEQTEVLLRNAAIIMVDLGVDAGVDLYRRIRAGRAAAWGVEHAETLDADDDVAIALRDLGRADDSVAEYELFLPVMQRVLGESHESHLSSLRGYARSLRAAGRESDAELVDARVNAGES
jgi:tetratricopeptide (TPR) repeat protein